MKKYKFLALALCAVLASVNFSSCSDDDMDEPTSDVPDVPKPSVEKRLTSVKYSYGYHCNIQYDANGLIDQIVRVYNGQTDKTTTYTYSSSHISVTETYSYGNSSTENYCLNNGLISELEGEIIYSYDEGRISKWRENDGSNKTFEWSTGDIMKTSTKWSDEPATYHATYRYSDGYDYGRIVGFVVDSNDMLYDDFEPVLVMQGFFGITPIHLPQDASDGSDDYAWSYEFDENGYPTSVTEYIGGSETQTITFTWEIIE
ncbi:MAG: DUF4595 domain-containing protein [Muribaculaceae bacterium]|nr:DUF4595 domain-containing protein [Muribaculaceae bacterium]